MGPLLSPRFFARSAADVAPSLLGCLLHAEPVTLRIVETEAYRQNDTACHAHRGRTPRTEPLFGPPGHVYVYLCYGIHRLVNLVCEAEGVAAGVLIRGATVVAGEALVRTRRGGRLDLIGPGKVGQALGAELGWTGRPSGTLLSVHAGSVAPTECIRRGPRVGIDYAAPEDRMRPWRFQLVPS
ncbi:MAG: DNA-3-methyladenine glycosylase [Myxococcota bacterium]|nr:DNA-3-methyladenine glycosylase [Myxococcota bacterium]MEC8425700.1 DNA-3-methyladenine glycosylase [Myxococcota bacterium]